MASTVNVEIDGLKERRAALKKAGASMEDLEGVNREAIEPWHKEALRRVPRRTGRLAKSIGVEVSPTTGKVVADASAVVYGPVIHFGWATRNAARGMTRKQAQSRFEGTLTRSTINKSFRQGRTRTNRAGVTKRGVRGGPIRPQPFMWEAADAKADEVIKRYEKQADEIAKVLAGG